MRTGTMPVPGVAFNESEGRLGSLFSSPWAEGETPDSNRAAAQSDVVAIERDTRAILQPAKAESKGAIMTG